MLATNKNFNKTLSGWFAQLFTDLQPTKEDVLSLQKELLSVLNSPHSKPVNTALQAIKKILAEDILDVDSFLDAVPVLLTSDTKATVASALMILEKIAKNRKDYRKKIGLLVCQAFIHQDEELQTRTAKLILANRDFLDESFTEELAPFHSSMLASTKKILEDFDSAEMKRKNHLSQKYIMNQSANYWKYRLLKLLMI